MDNVTTEFTIVEYPYCLPSDLRVYVINIDRRPMTEDY